MMSRINWKHRRKASLRPPTVVEIDCLSNASGPKSDACLSLVSLFVTDLDFAPRLLFFPGCYVSIHTSLTNFVSCQSHGDAPSILSRLQRTF